jgi:putative transposase
MGLFFLRESLTWVVQQLMEVEVSELTGPLAGERAPEWLTPSNGTGSEVGDTHPGRSSWRSRRSAAAGSFPSFLEPRRRSEQAPVCQAMRPRH